VASLHGGSLERHELSSHYIDSNEGIAGQLSMFGNTILQGVLQDKSTSNVQ